MRKKIFAALGLIILILALYFSNNNKLTSVTRSGLAMNTLIRITLESFNKSEADLNKILDEAFDYIKLFESQVSLYDANSQLNKINNMAGVEPVKVSSDVIELVAKSIEISNLTGKIFNPLIGPLTKLWKINQQGKNDFKLPEPASIDQALEFLDINIISLDLANQEIYLNKAGAVLDFGGIAKGFASRKLADKFSSLGIERALIDLGGNIQVVGSDWNIGIRDPLDKDKIALKIKVNNQAVITSGAYERFKIINGIKYSHFFDPRTGMPVKNKMLSASLIIEDGALADALATSFMIMGGDEAQKFLASHQDLNAILIIEEDNKIKIIETGKIFR